MKGAVLDDAAVLLTDDDSVATAITDLEALGSANVVEHNLSNAGARPADRTDHDERVLEQLRTGDGAYIDSQEEVGGYPDLAVNRRRLDIPQNGTHAWLRDNARSVE